MMKTARNLDIAIVVSGDGDFAPAIRAVQEQGVRVEVISFRGNTSSDLIEVADLFTDIVQLARVEKGSRSGRRVSDDGEDLSMTEVPDKLTEGTGAGRARGRGRGRGRTGEPEPLAASSATRGRSRTRPIANDAVAANGAGAMVAMPGERLARLPGSLTEADLAAAEVFTLDDLEDAGGDLIDSRPADGPRDGDAEGEDGQRRRRRRGGRGRGRGRGRGDGFDGPEGSEVAGEARDAAEGEMAAAAPVARPARPVRQPRAAAPVADLDVDDVDDDDIPAPRPPRAASFGSVWDSQIGTPAAASTTGRAPVVDDEDFDEPEIPEYLIAEQRRGAARSGGGGGGARGGRSAYRSAMERERYGGGSGSRSGGINRYPDVSARTTPAHDQAQRTAGGGFGRRDQAPASPRSSGEWSDVPPELEEQLRAQIAGSPPKAAAPARPAQADVGTADAATPSDDAPEAKPKRATTRKPAASKAAAPAEAPSDDDPQAKPKRATTRKPAASKAAPADPEATDAPEAKPKRATTRKPAAAKATDDADAPAAAKPKRASTRKPAESDPA